MNKIAFISVHIKKSPLSFPLSSAVLASAVDNAPALCGKTQTIIMDFFLDSDITECTEKIISSEINTAAFSIYIWNRSFVLSLIDELKKIKPEILIIAGGAEVTADPQFFSDYQEIDWIVNGEGEDELINYLNLYLSNYNNTDNIAKTDISDSSNQYSYINKIENIKTTNWHIRKSVSNPGQYPSPIIEKKINLNKYDGILWELSRGCPFNCGFCFESRGVNTVRKFPIERIKKELEIIVKSGIEQVFVLDPTFNIDRKRAKEILNLIKEKAPDIHFTFEARSEYIDTETADLFSDITCSLQIGLQSTSLDVLKNVNRTFDADDFYEKIQMLHQSGAVYGFDIIYGLPADTLQLFYESIDYAVSMQPNHLDIFPLAVLKGTDLYDKADTFGINWIKSDPYTVISTPDFPADDIFKAAQTADTVDFFYNKGKAVSFLPVILENIQLSPSEFFVIFSDWFNNNHKIDCRKASEIFSEYEITKCQTDFIKHLFSGCSMEKESFLAADIIIFIKNDSDNLNVVNICKNDLPPISENTDMRSSGLSSQYFNKSMNNELKISGLFDMDKVFNYLDSGVSDLEELVFFTRHS